MDVTGEIVSTNRNGHEYDPTRLRQGFRRRSPSYGGRVGGQVGNRAAFPGVTGDYMSQPPCAASTTAPLSFIFDHWNFVPGFQVSGFSPHPSSFVWGLDLSQTLQGAGGVGGLLSVVRGDAPYFTGYDANGNVTDYVSANGTTVAHYEFDPFGNTTAATGSMADAFVHRFSTKYWDSETELYYYGYRFYSPELGRWASRDPIAQDQGGLYCVLGNGQVNCVDLLGLTILPAPSGWENFDCCKLAVLMRQFMDDLKKRFNDMTFDLGHLYNNPNAIPRRLNGLGTWKGHQDAYKVTQDKLKDFNGKYKKDNCQPPMPEAEEWASKTAPSKPLWAAGPPPPELSSGERVGLVVLGAVIIIASGIEDVFTGGAGLADDPVTMGPAAAMIYKGLVP